MRIVSCGIGAAASILVMGLSFSSSADDFMQECMSATPGDAQKTCTCMSGQISGADRMDAVTGLRKTHVQANGDAPDPATLSPQELKGLQVVVVAQANCE
jgi:hypothetical protein